MAGQIALSSVQSLPTNSFYGVSPSISVTPLTYLITGDWTIGGADTSSSSQLYKPSACWNSNPLPPSNTSLLTGVWQDTEIFKSGSYITYSSALQYMLFNFAPHQNTPVTSSSTFFSFVDGSGTVVPITSQGTTTYGSYQVVVAGNVVSITYNGTGTDVLWLRFFQLDASWRGFRFETGGTTNEANLGIYMVRMCTQTDTIRVNPTTYLPIRYAVQALPFTFDLPSGMSFNSNDIVINGTAANVDTTNTAAFTGTRYWALTDQTPTHGFYSTTLGFDATFTNTGTRYLTAYISPGTYEAYFTTSTNTIIFNDETGAPFAPLSLTNMGPSTNYTLSTSLDAPYIIQISQAYFGAPLTTGVWIEAYQNGITTNPQPYSVYFVAESLATDAAAVMMMIISSPVSPPPPACYGGKCVVHVQTTHGFEPRSVEDVFSSFKTETVILQTLDGDAVECYMVHQASTTPKDMIFNNLEKDIALSEWHLVFVPREELATMPIKPCRKCKKKVVEDDTFCSRCSPFKFCDKTHGSVLISQLYEGQTAVGLTWYHFVPVHFEKDCHKAIKIGSKGTWGSEMYRQPLDKVLASSTKWARNMQ